MQPLITFLDARFDASRAVVVTAAAWRRQDDARAAGAARRRAGHPAAAEARGGARDGRAHRRASAAGRSATRSAGRSASSGASAATTRLLVATEGVLTARLQQRSAALGLPTIVLDEFHERSVHADLAIALARQAWRARDDLRIVVMSATLDSGGRRPRFSTAVRSSTCRAACIRSTSATRRVSRSPSAVVELLDAGTSGDVLCFLPGALEIRRAIAEIELRGRRRATSTSSPLYGSLDARDAGCGAASGRRAGRRVIVATNIAETSVTVPGVTAVVDSGLHKVARYDADRGIDSLEIERITADAADQRAGRAGRTAPGVVRRLWDARDRLRPHREPEIHRVDLSARRARRHRVGRRPATVRMVRARRATTRSRRRWRCSSGSGCGRRRRAHGDRRSRCGGCRCTRGWRAC